MTAYYGWESGTHGDSGVSGRHLAGEGQVGSASVRGHSTGAPGQLVGPGSLPVRFAHRALVGGQKPPLGQRSDPEHAGTSSSASSPLARAARWAARVDVAQPGPTVVIDPGVGNHHRAVSGEVRECAGANGERCPRAR